MPEPASRTAPTLWHASADAIAATLAGVLALAVFYPITLCAVGVKNLVSRVRAHPVARRNEQSLPVR